MNHDDIEEIEMSRDYAREWLGPVVPPPQQEVEMTTEVKWIPASDAHDGFRHTWLQDAYQSAFDNFAGPSEFRHGCNYKAYHRAGLIGVYNAVRAKIQNDGRFRPDGILMEKNSAKPDESDPGAL